ncbi:MAG: hypothetical protein C4555_05930 [Dehalococcoidia bacterium]|nr:MAG: hypothetical protein C4555_05930 [Dehalococcoidia bacterium]
MTNHAKVGGILSIISGAFGILGLFWCILMLYFFQLMVSYAPYAFPSPEDELALQFMSLYFVVIGVFLAILGIIAIVGGVYTLKRKLWGLALAGAICGTITFSPTGIAAIIFVVMGRPEFYAPVPPPATSSSAPPAAS